MAKVQTRKLAAIMFTDIAGFTKKMSFDENVAISSVRKKRSIILPLIKNNNGVFVKEIGDGTLSYFPSAIDASNCAIKIQELTFDDEHLNIRIGLHIGDILFDNNDVFGEGVNIASRLESLSPIGGVCVSKNVFDELENKKDFKGISLGLQSLKGVGKLIEVFALRGDKLKDPDISKYKDSEVKRHKDNEVPSMAIIPFLNKGADEDAFYAYGISSDLISACSSAGLIRVASLSDVEKLDFINLRTEEIAEKLLIRYIAQGVLWKMGEKFQLSIELYDSKQKKVLWSDRWQESWNNLTSIEEKLREGLLKVMNTSSKADSKTNQINPDAYELYLKGQFQFRNRKNNADIEVSRGLLREAYALDNNLLSARYLLAGTYINSGEFDKALIIYDNLIETLEKNEKGSLLANAYLMRTECIDDKNSSDSLDYLRKAFNIFTEINDKVGISICFRRTGQIYFRLGDFKKARTYQKKFYNLGKTLENDGIIIDSFHDRAQNSFFNGNIKNCIKYYKKALKVCKKNGDKAGLAFIYMHMALPLTGYNQYKIA